MPSTTAAWSDVEERVVEAQRVERFDRAEERFRVGVGALGADQLEPGLRELTHPALLRLS